MEQTVDTSSDCVRAWRETVTIPTYGIGDPDPNPMFLEKRVYQGSSGAVYPYPVIDRVEDERREKQYEAVFLENEFLKIMILPQLGGRIQMAQDKTNGYHFVYYNRVIKPALVGLAGPWISGGIEFNWPQHHRPNTFGPVQCHIAEGEQGEKIVWCGEIDRMERTQGTHGFILYPGKAYLEIRVRLFNRTELPQSFLWWANPGCHVDDHHQSVFPPDVHAVMDHGKRDVSAFPIATGTYYKVDYSPGTDISRYKNIPVPTSYMAYHSDFNFVGSYDHGRRTGLLHIANHHISPGKKQWTWGNGEFGYAWDRHLTDEDGPYIELMCGVFTDNQPDFSWLMPGEQKSFSQFFMPYKGVGLVRNATIDAAIGFEQHERLLTIRAYTTSEQRHARVELSHQGKILLEQSFDGSPRRHFEVTCPLAPEIDEAALKLVVKDASGRELVSAQPLPRENRPIPKPASAIASPEELDSTESLFLAGLHLEQYRHATRNPADYYREALRRDPGDLRNNNALGRLLFRSGKFEAAETHFRKAIDRLTKHNPNPYDSEAFYNLGLSLETQRRFDEAVDAYFKSTWSGAWQEAGFFALARLACRRRDLDETLTFAERCLRRNADHHRARHLEIYVCATRGEKHLATARIDQALELDPFNFGALYEQALLTGTMDAFDQRIAGVEQLEIELALDYAACGAYTRATDVLKRCLQRGGKQGPTASEVHPSPIVYYLLADFERFQGNESEADKFLAIAAEQSPRLCFPNRLEEIPVLRRAIASNPRDARAPYYLGNLLYAKRAHEAAISLWEQSRELDPHFATVWRNLGLAYYNKRRKPEEAWTAYNQAFRLDPTDARVLYELDQLAKLLARPPQERLSRLEQHPELVARRDDLFLECVTLRNILGNHREALAALLARRFHPWEGGEGKVPAQYVLALTQLARKAIAADTCQEAIEYLHRAQSWPPNLGEGKLIGIRENNIHYLLGVAHRKLGDEANAMAFFTQAADAQVEPVSAAYYNDQPPDMIFYQGLSLAELGRPEEARQRFRTMLEFGQSHLHDKATIEYFAVSLPDFLVFDDEIQTRHELHCRYMMALGSLGLRDWEHARNEFQYILRQQPHHLGATVHLPLLSAESSQSIGVALTGKASRAVTSA